MKKILLILALASICFSCSKDDEELVPTEPFRITEHDMSFLGIKSNEIIKLQVSQPCTIKILDPKLELAKIINISAANKWVSITMPENGSLANTDYIVNLDCSKTNISLLKGSFKNLSSIDVSSCVNLEELYCNEFNVKSQFKELTKLDISNCTSLNKLFCNDIKINSLNISGCTNLEYFQINGTDMNIESLDLSSCVNLQTVYLGGNIIFHESTFPKLKSVNISGCQMLAHLFCNGINIESLDISKNTYAPIYIEFYSCSILSNINISKDNRIDNLDFRNCDRLERIYCPDATEIDEVPTKVLGNHTIQNCTIIIDNGIKRYKYVTHHNGGTTTFSWDLV